jgi:hypothetical protein
MKKFRIVLAVVGIGLLVAFLMNPRQHITDFKAGFADGYDPGPNGR